MNARVTSMKTMIDFVKSLQLPKGGETPVDQLVRLGVRRSDNEKTEDRNPKAKRKSAAVFNAKLLGSPQVDSSPSKTA